MGIRGSFLGIKQPGRESDHSPPSSAEVKASTPLIRLHDMVKVKVKVKVKGKVVPVLFN
jgi:hypothetical protein